ncbi:MAG: hypothetical protein J7474_04200 [Arthrobacter sp.]|nr:hypothetical protein [Arthrobacter sp.]
MKEVTIGRDGTLIFRLEDATGSRSGKVENLTITAKLHGLHATKDVWDFDGWTGLSTFFESLALRWRGWDGEMIFLSTEGDFRLVAKHDGHIRIAFELNGFDRATPWTAAGQLTVDPGEELGAAVQSLRELLAAPKA